MDKKIKVRIFLTLYLLAFLLLILLGSSCSVPLYNDSRDLCPGIKYTREPIRKGLKTPTLHKYQFPFYPPQDLISLVSDFPGVEKIVIPIEDQEREPTNEKGLFAQNVIFVEYSKGVRYSRTSKELEDSIKCYLLKFCK